VAGPDQNVPAPMVVVCGNCGAKNRVPSSASGVPRCGRCHTTLPWVTEADDASFAEVVEASPLPVLVDLWAPWCGPCRMVSPALEQLAREFAGKVKLVKVNVDESPALSRRFGVQGIPTLLLTRRGEVVARKIGAAPADALRAWLEPELNRSVSQSTT
jgi:thioredoxin 2